MNDLTGVLYDQTIENHFYIFQFNICHSTFLADMDTASSNQIRKDIMLVLEHLKSRLFEVGLQHVIFKNNKVGHMQIEPHFLSFDPVPLPSLHSMLALVDSPLTKLTFFHLLYVRLQPLDIPLRSLDIDLRSLDIQLRSLDIHLRSLDIHLWSLDINLRSLDIDLRSLDFQLWSLDIDLRSLVTHLRSLVTDLWSLDGG